MSYNQGNDDGWETVPSRRDRNRDDDHQGGNHNAWQSDPRSRHNTQGGNHNAWQSDPRSSHNTQAPDEENWPTLSNLSLSSSQTQRSEVEEQPSWRAHPHSERQNQETAHSGLSMRGMFSALKKALKTKIYELTQQLREDFRKPPSEQHYAAHIDAARINVDPTDEELQDISRACNRLWDLDVNRLTPGKDYEIDCGEGTKVYQKNDQSENALFRHLNPDVFRRPTYARFYALLDNYSAEENVSEKHSNAEQAEEIAFIEEISRTAPIKYLKNYLSAKQILRGGDEEFKNTMRTLWFKFYNREGTRDSSSAFEHVFVGEVKRGRYNNEAEVSGLHNWIQFYVEEAKGNLDYQGFIMPRRRDDLPNSQTQLLTVQFRWKGLLKPVSSTLVGVSPEFEVALYTLCYYCGTVDNHVSLGPYAVNIKVFPLGRDSIGSAFPIAEE